MSRQLFIATESAAGEHVAEMMTKHLEYYINIIKLLQWMREFIPIMKNIYC